MKENIKENGQEIVSSPLGGEDQGEGYNNIANYNYPQPDILPSREKENGRSMIEMLGVLAIIGVLSTAGIAGYSKAMMKYRTNKTIEEITMISGNIRTFFAPQKSYEGLTSSNDAGRSLLKKAKLIPDEMWKTVTTISGYSSQIEHAFNSGILIQSFTQYLYILLYDIPSEACIDIITNDWREANVNKIVVSTSGHADVAGWYHMVPTIDMANAIDACSRSTDGFVNIEFRLK